MRINMGKKKRNITDKKYTKEHARHKEIERKHKDS